MAVKVKFQRLIEGSGVDWVEFCLVDAAGVVHVFEEKVPVVAPDLDARSVFPCDGSIDCSEIARRLADGREVVTVDTEHPWGIESRSGQTRFDVFREQLQ